MGTLWLIASPIGNLGDLAPRALDVLAEVALVACEDTRRSTKLLQHGGIRVNRLVVANDHTEYGLIDDVLAVLDSGRDVAVLSDAGTPGISDPGQRLVTAAIDAGHQVSAVPGPVAAIMALTISGLSSDRFVFEGFLPRKARERQQRLRSLTDEGRTMVFYEAPHRISNCLDDLKRAFGDDRQAAICRELTKVYEDVQRGTLGTMNVDSPRGEYVVVVAGKPDDKTPIGDVDIKSALRVELGHGLSKRDAINAVAASTGEPKNRIYELMNRL